MNGTPLMSATVPLGRVASAFVVARTDYPAEMDHAVGKSILNLICKVTCFRFRFKYPQDSVVGCLVLTHDPYCSSHGRA